jgi:hypothetical protein
MNTQQYAAFPFTCNTRIASYGSTTIVVTDKTVVMSTGVMRDWCNEYWCNAGLRKGRLCTSGVALSHAAIAERRCSIVQDYPSSAVFPKMFCSRTVFDFDI